MQNKLGDRGDEGGGRGPYAPDLLAELERYRYRVDELESELSTVREGTRREIGRWLHDDLAQVLVSLRLELARLESGVATDRGDNLRRASELALRAARTSREQIKQLMGGAAPMRDVEVDVVREFATVVKWFNDEFGIACHIETDGDPTSVSDDVAVALIYSVRELLVNVGRHSHALNARVFVEHVGALLRITVSDDGTGFENTASDSLDDEHFGLTIVEERLAQIGGHFTKSSVHGKGTKVVVSAPFDRGAVG